MNKPFTPLTSLAAGAASAQGIDKAKPVFAPLNQHAGTRPEGPRITVQKEGERITCIRIECACGELIELECVY